MPRIPDHDPPLPLLVTRRQAVTSGLTVDQVRQRVRSGNWERVRNGSFLSRDESLKDGDSEYVRIRTMHAFRALAAARSHEGSVIAYESAAALLNLPTFGPLDGPVNLVVPPGVGTGIRAGIRVRRLDLPDDHVDYDGTPFTLPGRTWMDVTRRGKTADSLVIGDDLLRRGWLTPDELLAFAHFAEHARLPGRRRVRAALELLDPIRESPLESASFGYFVDYRIPLPRCQVDIRDHRGSFVARVDFLWKNRHTGKQVVGEADGRMKYEDRESLYAEKRREDALRALGFGVVRWGMSDLYGPALARRLLTVL